MLQRTVDLLQELDQIIMLPTKFLGAAANSYLLGSPLNLLGYRTVLTRPVPTQ